MLFLLWILLVYVTESFLFFKTLLAFETFVFYVYMARKPLQRMDKKSRELVKKVKKL